MERTSGIRGDFIERFSMFKSAYNNARTKEEKNYIVEEFLNHLTEDEVALVRNVIGDVLNKNRVFSPDNFVH